MNTAALAIAAYGALTATGALGWQIYTWRWARKDRLEITALRLASKSYPLALLVRNTGERSVPVGLISIHVGGGDAGVRTVSIGRSELASLGAELPTEVLPAGTALPDVVPARNSVSIAFEADAVTRAGIDLEQPMTVELATGMGDSFRFSGTAVGAFAPPNQSAA